jgi:hypothetical protein
MRKRICYIHVGPHKTGTTSIQWLLQENSAELLKHSYFVPESETKRGARHALAERLAGLDVGEHRKPLVARSIAAITDSSYASTVENFRRSDSFQPGVPGFAQCPDAKFSRWIPAGRDSRR